MASDAADVAGNDDDLFTRFYDLAEARAADWIFKCIFDGILLIQRDIRKICMQYVHHIVIRNLNLNLSFADRKNLFHFRVLLLATNFGSSMI